MSDSFSDNLKILSSFLWDLFEKKIGTAFLHALVFTLVCIFRYTVGSGRGDGAASFAELDSDFSEPGKHVLNI